MKKLIYGSLLLASVGVLTIGCQKEPIDINHQSNKEIEYRLDKIPLIENKQDINRLLSNPDDKDDEKINGHLYNLSLAVRELIKDKDFNTVIIELAKESATQTANLLDLKEAAPHFYDKINENLSKNNQTRERYTIESIARQLTHRPIAPNPDYPTTAEIEQYIPAIFIPNIEQVNSNLQPILSPNIEVNSNKDESIDDNIVSWYYTESGELKEIILSEETSLNTSNPLFLLDNAVTTLETKQDKDFKPLNLEHSSVATPLAPNAVGKSALSFSTYEHSIESNDYRYEPWTSGKSEFAVTAYRIDPNGTTHWIYSAHGHKVISEIKKNQIGTIRNVWSHHAANWTPWSNPWTPNVTQTGVNMVYWNTYERDWNRSLKALGTCTANGATIHLAGRRKYDSEWYAWIPASTNVHYTRFQWVYDNWAHWNNSWKSQFRIWRVGA